MPDTTGQPDQPHTTPVTVPQWRFPGPDRQALMEQRAGLIDEVRALEASIAAKWRQINALGDLAGLPRSDRTEARRRGS